MRFLKLSPHLQIFHDILHLPEADLDIIAVQDHAISEVFDLVRHRNNLIVHTSGSVEHTLLNRARHYGVFYPLQTFSINKEVDWKGIPLFIEASDNESKSALYELAIQISGFAIYASDNQRKSLHIAAVFANNFSNHMMALAQQWLNKFDLSFDVLVPLIQETIAKLAYLTPEEAQTGPARRHDMQVIAAHLTQMENEPNLSVLYQVISDSILAMYPVDKNK